MRPGANFIPVDGDRAVRPRSFSAYNGGTASFGGVGFPWLWSVLAWAALLVAIAVSFRPAIPVIWGDTPSLVESALRTLEAGRPTVAGGRDPGYPAFLAVTFAFGGDLGTVVRLQQGGVGRPDAGACSNRPGGDAQRRWARADHPGDDVSGPAAVQERPHRRASLCGVAQSGNGWIARCHLRRQNGAVLRGRCLRPVRGARGVLQIAGSPGPNRRRPSGRPPRPARHDRARCRDCRVRRCGAGAPRHRFPVRGFQLRSSLGRVRSPRHCSAIT